MDRFSFARTAGKNRGRHHPGPTVLFLQQLNYGQGSRQLTDSHDWDTWKPHLGTLVHHQYCILQTVTLKNDEETTIDEPVIDVAVVCRCRRRRCVFDHY